MIQSTLHVAQSVAFFPMKDDASLSAPASACLRVSVSGFCLMPVSVSTCPCLPVPAYACRCLLHLSTPVYTCLHLPVLCSCLHLSLNLSSFLCSPTE